MALLPGKNCTVKLDTAILARISSFSLTINNETIDAIYFGSDWTKAIDGIQSWSATISGFMDIDSTSDITFRQAAENHTMLVDLEFYINATNYYAPDVAADSEAGCWIETYNITSDNGSIVGFDSTIKGNGPIGYN